MLADSFFYYLVLVGFAAGLMDAAVGGGGLLQIPGLFNLLPNATPVASVMGVNKFASCCGTLTATGQYLRRIPVPWKMLLPARCWHLPLHIWARKRWCISPCNT